MDKRILAEYRRLRAKNWPAASAMRAARVNVAWGDAEDDGLVELTCEPDQCSTIEECSGDYSDLVPHMREKYRKQDLETAERDGIWVYSTHYRASVDSEVECADSIGGVTGDFQDSGYDVDLKSAALEALDELLSPLIPVARKALRGVA